MKPHCLILFLLALTLSLQAQQTTCPFAERDTLLYMDIYSPAKSNGYCVVHVFGGGFIAGARNTPFDVQYCQLLAEQGYTVAAIDYRLGLQGVQTVGVGNIAAIERAIQMGVEDCSAAIAYLIDNADLFSIDPARIIIEGSSAGAIIALQTDYAHANALPMAAALPQEFRPAGIVAYSGAIFSRLGKVSYPNHAPAPTLFLHGTSDRIVFYNQLALGKTGIYGANALVKRFEKFRYPYAIRRYVDLGHEVATFGPHTVEVFNAFVRDFIIDGRRLFLDTKVHDDAFPPSAYSKLTVKSLYSPKNREDL